MAKDLAIRLADATPLILGDALCLAVMAFLSTRLWIAAAPALGRRIGRLFLAVVLPLGLAVSVVAHGWIPEKASESVRASERDLPLFDEPEAKPGRGAPAPLHKET